MQKYENFCKALQNLEEINRYAEPYGTVELTGMVALYEICFEQAWKTVKDVLEESGYAEGKTGSPKLILKTAYSAGMIRDEAIWLSALEARNHAARAYNELIAMDIIRHTKSEYIDMFKALQRELEQNWIEK